MEKSRFRNLMEDFEKAMEKHGFTGYEALELDTNQGVHGPYFGWIPGTDKIIVGFSLTGENGCPCCIEQECEE